MSKAMIESKRKLRVDLVAKARAIYEKADVEKRSPTSEERTQFKAMMDDQEKMADDISDLERLEKESRSINDETTRADGPELELRSKKKKKNPDDAESRWGESDDDGSETRDDGDAIEERHLKEYRASLDRRHAKLYRSMPVQPVTYRRFRPELRSAAYHRLFGLQVRALLNDEMSVAEKRALSAGDFTAGGATYVSEQWTNEMIKFLDDVTFMRRICRVIPVRGADSLGGLTYDTDMSDAEWTSEIKTGSEDEDMAFGKKKLTPHALAKRLKISNTLIQRSAIDINAFAQERMGYKFAVTIENAAMTGTGHEEALGIFTAAEEGIPTSRDVSTENTSTAVTADGLKNAFYSLKAPYRRRASWILHRNLVLMISKLRDGEGRYMWQPSLVVGDPDSLLGVPMLDSEFAPSTFTASQYVACLGDFSFYWFAEALGFNITKLPELYAETNQTGLIGRAEIDGGPMLGEAFARVQLAA